MAILGGAGNPVGGSFTGPAEALEIVGDHAYAYSGVITAVASSSADSTMLKFTSGNFYFVGFLDFTDAIEGTNDHVYLEMSLNDTTIITLIYKAIATSNDNLSPYNIIIPPYTEVEIKYGSTGNNDATAWLSGRIYRTSD